MGPTGARASNGEFSPNGELCWPFPQALMVALYVSTFTATLVERISSSSRRARCHCFALPNWLIWDVHSFREWLPALTLLRGSALPPPLQHLGPSNFALSFGHSRRKRPELYPDAAGIQSCSLLAPAIKIRRVREAQVLLEPNVLRTWSTISIRD